MPRPLPVTNDYAQAIQELKRHAHRPVTPTDLWEFLVAAIGIRRFFKGDMINLKGGESSQEVFDRKLKEVFGLEFRNQACYGKDRAKAQIQVKASHCRISPWQTAGGLFVPAMHPRPTRDASDAQKTPCTGCTGHGWGSVDTSFQGM